jgi:hypothetical protein
MLCTRYTEAALALRNEILRPGTEWLRGEPTYHVKPPWAPQCYAQWKMHGRGGFGCEVKEIKTKEKSNNSRITFWNSRHATDTNLPHLFVLSATVIQPSKFGKAFSCMIQHDTQRTISVCSLSKSITGLKMYPVNTRSTNFYTWRWWSTEWVPLI